MSEEYYNSIENFVTNEIPSLPVTNVSIIGVTGVRSKKVEKQVFLDLRIAGKDVPVVVLVVKNIQVDFLLGCDFLYQYQGTIDYRNKMLTFLVQGVQYSENFLTQVSEKVTAHIKLIRSNKVGIHVGDSEIESAVRNFTADFKQNDDSLDIANDIEVLLNEKVKDAVNKCVGESGDVEGEIKRVLYDNRAVFSDCPGKIKNFVAKFTLKTNKPFIGKPYPIPYSKRSEVAKEIEKMERQGIIEKSSSSYSNPLVCVMKSDNSLRLCMDCRNLNSHIQEDRECTEKTEEIFPEVFWNPVCKYINKCVSR